MEEYRVKRFDRGQDSFLEGLFLFCFIQSMVEIKESK